MVTLVYWILCVVARKKFIIGLGSLGASISVFVLILKAGNRSLQVTNMATEHIKVMQESRVLPPVSTVYSPVRQERHHYLAEKCRGESTEHVDVQNLFQQNSWLDHLGFVIRSKSLFYCAVPKVATRMFLAFLTFLHIHHDLLDLSKSNLTHEQSYIQRMERLTQFNVEYLSRMMSSSTKFDLQLFVKDRVSVLWLFQSLLGYKYESHAFDLWAMYRSEVFPLVRVRSLSNNSVVFMDNFMRVIFVRHPFERLASAYMDKIASLQEPAFSLYDNIRRMICRKFASYYLNPDIAAFYQTKRIISNMTAEEPCSKVVPKFKHFVQYIILDSKSMDVHWQPYSTLCKVCALKYNFIGKYETLGSDVAALMKRVNVTSTEWYFNERFGINRMSMKYKNMYSSLSDDVICHLKQFYWEDFRLFDYKIEDYLIGNRKIICSSLN